MIVFLAVLLNGVAARAQSIANTEWNCIAQTTPQQLRLRMHFLSSGRTVGGGGAGVAIEQLTCCNPKMFYWHEPGTEKPQDADLAGEENAWVIGSNGQIRVYDSFVAAMLVLTP